MFTLIESAPNEREQQNLGIFENISDLREGLKSTLSARFKRSDTDNFKKHLEEVLSSDSLYMMSMMPSNIVENQDKFEFKESLNYFSTFITGVMNNLISDEDRKNISNAETSKQFNLMLQALDPEQREFVQKMVNNCLDYLSSSLINKGEVLEKEFKERVIHTSIEDKEEDFQLSSVIKKNLPFISVDEIRKKLPEIMNHANNKAELKDAIDKVLKLNFGLQLVYENNSYSLIRLSNPPHYGRLPVELQHLKSQANNDYTGLPSFKVNSDKLNYGRPSKDLQSSKMSVPSNSLYEFIPNPESKFPPQDSRKVLPTVSSQSSITSKGYHDIPVFGLGPVVQPSSTPLIAHPAVEAEVISITKSQNAFFTKLEDIITQKWHNQLDILPMNFTETVSKISSMITQKRNQEEQAKDIKKEIETINFDLVKDTNGRYTINPSKIKEFQEQSFTGKIALPRVDKKGNPIKLPNIVKGEREPLIAYDFIHFDKGNINTEKSFFYKRETNFLKKLLVKDIGFSVLPDDTYNKLSSEREKVKQAKKYKNIVSTSNKKSRGI